MTCRRTRCLSLSGLLQAALKLSQLASPGCSFLSSPAQVPARCGLLPTSLFELATNVGEFLCPCDNGLLRRRNLLSYSRKTLLRLRQLFLQIGNTLRLCLYTAIDLTCSLFGRLRGLLCGYGLCLSLLTGLVYLRELLLRGLRGLLERRKLRLSLVA